MLPDEPATGAVVEIVSVTVDPLLPEALDGVTAEGKRTSSQIGKPEHALEENETELLYPDGPTVIVNCAACPASTVCEAGDTPNVKSFTLVVFGATAIVNACVFVSDETAYTRNNRNHRSANLRQI